MKKLAVSLLSAGILFFGAPVQKAEAGVGLVVYGTANMLNGYILFGALEAGVGAAAISGGLAAHSPFWTVGLIVLDEEGNKVEDLQLSESEAEILKEAMDQGATTEEVLELAEVLTADS